MFRNVISNLLHVHYGPFYKMQNASPSSHRFSFNSIAGCSYINACDSGTLKTKLDPRSRIGHVCCFSETLSSLFRGVSPTPSMVDFSDTLKHKILLGFEWLGECINLGYMVPYDSTNHVTNHTKTVTLQIRSLSGNFSHNDTVHNAFPQCSGRLNP